VKTLALSEAKNRFSEVIAWVEAGQEVAVTRRGVTLAKVVGLSNLDVSDQPSRVASAFATIAAEPLIVLSGELKVIARDGLD